MRRVLMGLALPCLVAAAPAMTITAQGPRFEPAAQEYRGIWEAEGRRIVAALERETGLIFPEPPVAVTVREGVSGVTRDGRRMFLRASYSADEKKGALVHELGHLLVMPQAALRREVGEHRLLNLFLYDVWTNLYGRDFADRMVEFERRKHRRYRAAWAWALAMTREERRARFQSLLRETAAPTA
jgi:hypothetical protein